MDHGTLCVSIGIHRSRFKGKVDNDLPLVTVVSRGQLGMRPGFHLEKKKA